MIQVFTIQAIQIFSEQRDILLYISRIVWVGRHISFYTPKNPSSFLISNKRWRPEKHTNKQCYSKLPHFQDQVELHW